MKVRDDRLEKLERVLQEAHLSRTEKQPSEAWRRRLLEHIRGQRPAPRYSGGASPIVLLQGIWRWAPALALASALIFAGVWTWFNGVDDQIALATLTRTPAGVELSVLPY